VGYDNTNFKKKLYRESWPKFKQVTKKVPTPQTLELLAFDGKSTFEWFALFLKAYKRGWLYMTSFRNKAKKNLKWIIHQKLTVPTSVIFSLTRIHY
jgi:hypothetical protein